MSLLMELWKEDPEEEAPRRWVAIHDADPSIEAPECKVLLEFASQREFDQMVEKFRPKQWMGGLGLLWIRDLTEDKLAQLADVLLKKVKGWSGVGRQNLIRMSSVAIRRKTSALALPDDIPFSEDERTGLAKLISSDDLMYISAEMVNRDAYGVEMQQKNV